jgi:hypothetical protein
MAGRMDSLSAIRSMFFAIGAAHLPGDSGVIHLLRSRGFRVEPVFSAKQVPGDEYAAGLKQKEWTEIKVEDGVYTVKMPGQPSEVGQPGDPKMKLFFDLTTMSFYMSGHYFGYDEKTRSLDQAMRDGARNMGDKFKAGPVVSIEHNGLQGRETITTKDGYTMRLRFLAKGKILYILAVGTLKKEMINGPDAARFFASFAAGETKLVKKPWVEFSLPGKAFSVRVPGLPEPQKEIDEKVKDNPSWAYKTYQSTDPQTGYYFLVQKRQVKAGFTIQNDATYLVNLKEDYAGRLDTITRYEIGHYKGYPASWMNYEDRTVKGAYKVLHVVRGNQVYMLLGGAPKGSNMADIDSFLHSLVILPYEVAKWQKEEGPGFSTLAPAPFSKTPPDSTSANRWFFAEYSSYNEKDAVSYVVQKSVFSPTWWAENDSTLMEEKLRIYKGESDSLLQKTWIENNGFKGLDVLIRTGNSTTLKKIRLLVNRDTLYTVLGIVQAREWEAGNHQKFFEAFRLQNEITPTVYTRKVPALLQALTTTDSTAFEAAIEDFESVSFRKEDLPLLHKAMLETYRDNEDNSSANNKLMESILPLADSTTVRFAKEAYARQTGKKEENRYRLLQLLARMETSESFAALKPFLLADLPKSGNPILLQRPLLDTLQLSATLFPELLQKADDSLLAPVIAAVADRLLDSSLLTVAQLKSYRQTVLKGAENEFKLLGQKVYEPWELIRWARLLSWLNDQEANAFLQRLLRQNDPPLKQAAIMALLKNNQPVPATEIANVAADRSQRIYFYDALKTAGKEALFPALYATQKSLAESEAHNLLAEDYDDFTLTYIGQRMAAFEGAQQLFHLFKVRLAFEDDGVKRDYLYVAGPYPATGKAKVLWGAATGMYEEERFQPQKTDKQLKAYLLSIKPTEK